MEQFRSSVVEIVPYTGRIRFPGHIPDKIARGDDAASSEPPFGGYIGSSVAAPFDPGIIGLPIFGDSSRHSDGCSSSGAHVPNFQHAAGKPDSAR